MSYVHKHLCRPLVLKWVPQLQTYTTPDTPSTPSGALPAPDSRSRYRGPVSSTDLFDARGQTGCLITADGLRLKLRRGVFVPRGESRHSIRAAVRGLARGRRGGSEVSCFHSRGSRFQNHSRKATYRLAYLYPECYHVKLFVRIGGAGGGGMSTKSSEAGMNCGKAHPSDVQKARPIDVCKTDDQSYLWSSQPRSVG